jgi:hypothetical protein
VLNRSEQEAWDEIVRAYPQRRRPHGRGELPAVVVGAGWSAVLLVLFGVPMAGLAVGAAAALIWLVWRFLPSVDSRRW